MDAKKIFICRVENTATCRALEYSRAFGRGQFVDLGESIGRIGKEEIKLADLVRLYCFEELELEESGQELGAVALEGENGEGD